MLSSTWINFRSNWLYFSNWYLVYWMYFSWNDKWI